MLELIFELLIPVVGSAIGGLQLEEPGLLRVPLESRILAETSKEIMQLHDSEDLSLSQPETRRENKNGIE